jgi:hypothetical protein
MKNDPEKLRKREDLGRMKWWHVEWNLMRGMSSSDLWRWDEGKKKNKDLAANI